jgi:hypothetical protein
LALKATSKADAHVPVFDEDNYEMAMRAAIRAIFRGGSAVDAAIDLPLLDLALSELCRTGEPIAERLADRLDALRARRAISTSPRLPGRRQCSVYEGAPRLRPVVAGSSSN